jgi:hypothetical protein
MFVSAQCEKGSMLVGLATRIGMRLGLHQDPRHFNFSPWITEVRRRIWNHLMFLDHPAFNGEGAVSGLDLVSNVQRCVNANDDQWTPARSTAAPPDADGFTDMSLVIMRSELFVNMRRLIKLQKEGTQEDLARAVQDHKRFMTRKFLTGLDESDPMQAVLGSYVRSGLAYHQLFSDFVAAKKSRQADIEQQAK